MKTWLLFGWLLSGAPDFAGTYAVHGEAPNGTYTATLEIIQHGEVFEVRWTFPKCDGMAGVGFVRDGELVIGYAPAGVVVYRMTGTKPRTMEASYAGWGFGQTYTEKAVEGSPSPCVPSATPDPQSVPSHVL